MNWIGARRVRASRFMTDNSICRRLPYSIRRLRMGFQRRAQPSYVATLTDADPGVIWTLCCAAGRANQ